MESQKRTERIGIDIGRVICEVDADASSTEGPQIFTEILDAADVIDRLIVERFGPENVFLVSKCGPKRQIKTLKWLHESDFMTRAGLRLKPHNVTFCLHRADKAKMAKELKLTHFIDDRFEVLSHMIDTVETLIAFNPQEKERREFSHLLDQVLIALNWNEVEEILL